MCHPHFIVSLLGCCRESSSAVSGRRWPTPPTPGLIPALYWRADELSETGLPATCSAMLRPVKKVNART
jgi:hypothetical protein